MQFPVYLFLILFGDMWGKLYLENEIVPTFLQQRPPMCKSDKMQF